MIAQCGVLKGILLHMWSNGEISRMCYPLGTLVCVQIMEKRDKRDYPTLRVCVALSSNFDYPTSINLKEENGRCYAVHLKYHTRMLRLNEM